MKIFINRPPAAKLPILVDKNVTWSAHAISIMVLAEFCWLIKSHPFWFHDYFLDSIVVYPCLLGILGKICCFSQLFVIVYHCLSLVIIIHYCSSLFIIVYHCLSLFIIVYHCLSLFIIVYHYLSLFIIVYYSLLLFIIVYWVF